MKTEPRNINPFPGLRPFREDEDYLFFGREEQTMELLQRLGSHRFVAVVGTSGSGKSSLVRCGLLSELLGGKMLQAGAAWEIAITHPGGNPLALLTDALLEADLYDREADHARENLLATLSRSHFGLVEAVKQAGLGGGTNFLLVVDQFEEIFRFHEAGQVQREVANEFISLLLEAVAQTDVPIYIVLTMRSDFIGECGQFEGLAELVNRGEFLIPRLTREQYKRVIEGPIKVAGGQIAPRLLQRLLNDLGQQVDQLPCLQHALMRTWNIWTENGDTEALDLDDYQRVGKMTHALSIHADEIYESLATARQRDLCRGIFQALTVQESEQRGIRRPARLGRLSQILDVPTAELLPIIDAYRRSGVTFLMPSEEVELTDQTIIDISHESLMRVWTRLRHWVEEEAQAAGIYRRLSESAQLHEQAKAGLFRDPELGIALAWKEAQHPNEVWAERYHPGFETAMRFLEESRQISVAEEEALEAARQRELDRAQQLAEIQRERLEQQQRAASRLRKMMAGIAGVAVFAAVACVFALVARGRANHLAGVAQEKTEFAEQKAKEAEESQQETADALAQVNVEKNNALLSLNKAEAAEERSRNFRYATDMQLAGRLINDENSNARQILDYMSEHDPAQNEELAGKADPRGFEWHYLRRMIDSRATVFRGFNKPVVDSILTPEGELITLDEDSRLERHDVETRLETHAPLDLKQGREIASRALSPDGRLVALSVGNQVQLVDTLTGAEAARPTPIAAKFGLIFSPDGSMLVTIDQKIGWWEVSTGRPIALEDSKLLSSGPLSISADGLTLAVGGQSGDFSSSSFSLFRANPDAREITIVHDKKSAEMGSMRTLALSPDGKFLLASQLFSGALVLFDSESGTYKSQNRSEHAASISAIGFNPAGSEIVTASLDGTIKVWEDFQDFTSPRTTGLMGHADEVNRVLFAPGGKKLVSCSHDQTTRLWDLDQKSSTLQQAVAGSAGERARFSPDGLLIAASESHQIWDSETGKTVSGLLRSADGMLPDCVAFSPDNRLLALGFGGTPNVSFIELWDIDRNELLATLPGTTSIPGFSTTATTGLITALAFSPDGKQLVAGYGSLNSLPSGDRGSHPLLVYDVTTHRLIRRLEGHRNQCVSVSFSQDGSRLASASYDGTARIWDAATWKSTQEFQNPDPASDQGSRRVLDVAFSPDTELLAMASHEGNVHVWNVATGDLVQTLRGHTNGVWSVAFSPDGKTLASGSQDQTIRLWNRATWRELLQLENKTSSGARALVFSPTGDRLLSAGGGTFLWSAVSGDTDQTEKLVQQLQRLLDTEADFQHRIRMLSENLQLHLALEVLQRARPDDVRLQSALAATRANWHASREEWKEAAEAFDQLKVVSPGNPEDWLLTPGLMRVATAFLIQQRTIEAAALLSGGELRRMKDGGLAIVAMFGYQFETSQFPLKVSSVFRGSAAWKAGMRVGDEILKFNGIELTAETNADMQKASSGGVGTTITLTIRSPGEEATKNVELTKASFINDDLLNGLIETLVTTVHQQLTVTPKNAGLLELKAEIAGQWSGFEAQVADYTAAIEILSELPEAEAAADLTRLYRRRGDAYVGLKKWPLAQQDYDRIVTEKPTDEDLLTNQTLVLAESYLLNWTILKPTEMKSASGAVLELQEDDSIFVGGNRQVKDVYSLGFQDVPNDFLAIRLEAISDDRLPGRGPGTYPVGNFVLSKIEALIPDEMNPTSATLIPLRAAFASYEERPLEESLKEGESGWSVSPGGLGQNQTAVFAVENQTENLTSGRLRILLKFDHVPNDKIPAILGRFRLSVSSDPQIIEQTRLFDVIKKPADPWAKRAAAYRIEGDQQAIDELVKRQPLKAGIIGDLFIEGENKDWLRAIEIYSLGITLNATDVELHSKRARAYEELKNWQSATADWLRAAAGSPNGHALLTEFAKRLITADQSKLAQAQFERAQRLLETDLKTDPHNIVVQEQLAQLLLDKLENGHAVQWSVLKLVEMKTAAGTSLTVQEDGSLSFNLGSDTITLPQGEKTTTAIRLEPITAGNSTQGDGVPSTEYQIVAAKVAESPAGVMRGRFVRIDLPGDKEQYPQRILEANTQVKVLSLAEVQIFQGDENIALAGTARQSSDYESGTAGKATADRAVDGNTDGHYRHRSVTHATIKAGSDPWWEVDLGDEMSIDRLMIWNRTDFGIGRLDHFRIRVLDDQRRVVFEQLTAAAPNPSREIRSPIALTQNPLEVAGNDANPTLGFTVNRDVFPWNRYRISTSVDDLPVVSDEVAAGEMQWLVPKPVALKTGGTSQLVWQENGSILHEEIAGETIRVQAPSQAFQALRIESSVHAASTSETSTFSEYQIVAGRMADSQTGKLKGQFVRIDLPGENKQFPRHPKDGDKKYLNLAELQVFQGDQNIALRPSVRQSGVSEGNYAPQNAVDGNTIGSDDGHPYFHSWDTSDPWWEVDLGSEQEIDRMLVWNRSDADLFTRMNHFRIRVLDSSRKVVFEQVIDEAPNPSRAIVPTAIEWLKNAPGADASLALRLSPDAIQSRFRISTTDMLVDLGPEKDIASVQQITDAPTRLAAAYALGNSDAESVKWFDRAINDADSDKARSVVIAHAQAHDEPLAVLLKLHPGDRQLQLAQARNLVQHGLSALAQKNSADALNKLQQARTQFEALLAKFPEPEWTALKPLEMKSAGGATLNRQDDNSILASGENPNQDSYTITARSDTKHITAFRLEAIPDPSLPKNGPGRYPGNGNYSLSGLQIHAGSDRVQLSDILVKYSENESYRKILAGTSTDRDYWGNDRRAGQPNAAVFVPVSPLTEPGPLTFQLNFFRSDNNQHNLGHFRLSVTSDAGAIESTKLRQELLEIELANLDVALGKAYALQQRTEDAATDFARALDRLQEEADRKQIVEQITDELEALTRLAERKPHETPLQLALAKRRAEKGNQLLAQGRRAEALSELDLARTIFARLIADSPEPQWTVLEPVEMTSRGGATLTLQPNGSILASGPDPDSDIYTLSAITSLNQIAAVRLEALPDLSLPRNGPGRGSNTGAGNFHLNEFRLFAAERPVRLTEIFVEHDQYHGEKAAIDGVIDSAMGWSNYPRTGIANTAIIQTEMMLSAGEVLKCELHMSMSPEWKQHNLGHFRLSVTSDSNAIQSTVLRQEIQASGLPELNLLYGNALGQQGKIEEAATAFGRVLDLTSDRAARAKILDEASLYTGVLDQLSQQRSSDAAVQDALARHFQSRNDVPNASRAVSQARALYERQLSAEPANSKLAQDLADLLSDVHPVEWILLRPVEMLSAGGATLTLLDDGSILASGTNPQRDAYTVLVDSSLEQITGIRLEAIPDDSLPGQGPGRFASEAGRGNFHLNEFRVISDGRMASLSRIRTTFDESKDAASAIDGLVDNRKGWSIFGQTSQAHHADITTDLKRDPGSELKFELHFSRNNWTEHNLGRFRLSATRDQMPTETYSAGSSASPWTRLGAAYVSRGEFDKGLDSFARSIELAGTEQAKAAAAQHAAAFDEIFARLQERFPGDRSLRLGQAKIQASKDIQQKKYQAALELVTSSLEIDPQNVELLNLQASALRGLRQWQAAIGVYSRVAELETDEARRREIDEALANTQLRMGQTESAAETYTRQMLLFPNEWNSRDAFLAQLLAGNPAAAKVAVAQMYKYAVDRHDDPYLSESLVIAHITLPGLVTPQNQARLLQAAQEAGEDRTPFLTAAIYYRLGDLQRAQPLLTTSSVRPESMPLASLLFYDQGATSQARSNLVDAASWFDRERKYDPESVIPAQQGWQDWSYRLELWREAQLKVSGPRLPEIDTLLAKEPDNVPALLERAELLLQVGLNEQALRDLNRAVRLQAAPQLTDGLRGRILAGLNRFDEAMIELNKSLQAGSSDPLVFAERGRVLFVQRQFVEAHADFNRSMELQPNEAAAQGMADLLLAEAERKNSWTVLVPTEMSSAKGATFTALEDHSILVGGKNQLGDAYHIVAEAEVTQVRAIRLEALTHPSLPGQGPGRDETRDPGNFSLTDLEIRSRNEDGSSLPFELNRAAADYSVEHIPVSVKNWNVGGRASNPHTAYFQTGQSIQFEQRARIEIRMQFSDNPDWPLQNLGHFRLSVSAEPNAFEFEHNRLAAMKIGNPWARLIAAYRLSGNDSEVAKLLEQRPELVPELADYFLTIEDWEQAIALYSKSITAETTDVSLLTRRAEAYGRAGEWKLAEADWQRVFAQAPELSDRLFQRFRSTERWNEAAIAGWHFLTQKPDDSIHWLQMSVVLVMSGDEAGYKELCLKMARQFEQSTNPEDFERVCKASILLPGVVNPSQLPEKPFADAMDAGTVPEWFPAWGWLTRAGLAYRRGDAESALEYLEKSEALTPQERIHANNLVLQAMVLQKLERHDEARKTLEEAKEFINGLQKRPEVRGDHDVLIALISLREAEALINGENEPEN